MKWEKLTPIEAGSGGCAHCGYQHSVLPMESIIAVGFGDAALTKDGVDVFCERSNMTDEEIMTVAQAEEMAKADPDHDWRIHLIAPLSERHYQRQGDNQWVLYEKGQGFA